VKKIIFILCLFSINLALGWERPELPLRGQGQYSWMFFKVYEAKLWGAKGDDIYSRPLLLELKYNRSFKGKDIAEQSIKEIANADNTKFQSQEWSKKLLEIFPDVKEGDVITASFNPQNGITFYFNQTKEIGRISELEFAKIFLNIWLGEKTSAPELRGNLLGEKT